MWYHLNFSLDSSLKNIFVISLLQIQHFILFLLVTNLLAFGRAWRVPPWWSLCVRIHLYYLLSVLIGGSKAIADSFLSPNYHSPSQKPTKYTLPPMGAVGDKSSHQVYRGASLHPIRKEMRGKEYFICEPRTAPYVFTLGKA